MVAKRSPDLIIEEIKQLLEDLAVSVKMQPGGGKQTIQKVKSESIPKGALGAIKLLMEEGFFDTPREIAAVIERLKEIGHYHKRNAISMNLLNLTKRRELNRFKNKETTNWEYVLRR